MARYRARPTEVDAILFTGENWDEVSAFAGNGHQAWDASVRHDVSSHSLLVTVPDGVARCRAGDWLVRDADGRLLPWDDASFAAAYESLP